MFLQIYNLPLISPNLFSSKNGRGTTFNGIKWNSLTDYFKKNV